MTEDIIKNVEIKEELQKEKKRKKAAPAVVEEEKTTADLIASGELIRADDLKKIIDEELAKRMAEQKADPKKFEDTRLISTYKQLTALTDEEFIKRLIKWHVNIDHAKLLFDYHATLDQKKVWQFLRDNYKPPKKY